MKTMVQSSGITTGNNADAGAASELRDQSRDVKLIRVAAIFATVQRHIRYRANWVSRTADGA